MGEVGFTAVLIVLELTFSLVVLMELCKAGVSRGGAIISGVVLFSWLLLVFLLLNNGFFSWTGMPQWSFTLGVALPVILGLFFITRVKSLSLALSNMDTRAFLYLQCWRAVFGVLFFFTAALPMWFKLLGGLGDIAAGLGAFYALVRYKKLDVSQAIIRGNLVGTLDFLVVLSLGAGVVLQDESPDIPFNLIPLYVVPIFIWLHVYSLKKLKT